MAKASRAGIAQVNHMTGAGKGVYRGVRCGCLHLSSTKPVRGSLVQSPMMQRHQESPEIQFSSVITKWVADQLLSAFAHAVRKSHCLGCIGGSRAGRSSSVEDRYSAERRPKERDGVK